MESRLLTLVVVCLGIFFQFYALPAVSQVNEKPEPSPPPPEPLPPAKSTLVPPPPLSSPPPPPLRSTPIPPSSPSPKPPPPPPPPPPPSSPRPPPPSQDDRLHRSPTILPAPSQDNQNRVTSSSQGLNLGKKIGLMFLGIVGFLQVCVVAFLVIKRRQLLANGRY